MRRRQSVWMPGGSFRTAFGSTTVFGLALLLGGACVSEEPSKEPPGEVAKYIVDKAPEKLTALNINFDDKVTLLGVEIDPGLDVAPGKRVKLTMYWRADKALDDPSWKLFTHVLDGAGDRVLNIDNVGPLRQAGPSGQAWPPGRWVPGKIYVDSQTFTVPKKLKSASLQVVTGIWKGRERLPVRGGASASEDRAVVATFNVAKDAAKDKKPERSVPELTVARLPKGSALRIDGVLDEAAWKNAADTGAFVNVKSGSADAASAVQGSAKLLWDDKGLIVGATIKDPKVVGGFEKGKPDQHLWTKDCLELMVDPDGDGDNADYYEIQINPQNLVFDSRFEAYNKPRQEPNGPFGHQDWSAKLESAVKVQGTLDKADDQDQGYVVEVRVPWSSFDKAKSVPPKPGDAWRLNLYAMQDNNGVSWSPILGQGNFHKASRFGRVRWVETLAEGTPVASTGPEKLPASAVPAPSQGADAVIQKKAAGQLPAPPPVLPSPAVPPPPPKPAAPTTAPASATTP
jgi:cellulose/xylan binding protein with CBM9 domain